MGRTQWRDKARASGAKDRIDSAWVGHGEAVERPPEVRPALQRGLDAVAKGNLALVEIVLAPI